MVALPSAAKSPSLTTPDRDVWLIDALPCRPGDTFSLTFVDAAERWRQGVWLATDGVLRVAEVEAPQFVLWRDTAPQTVLVRVATTDGLLRLYNVWDSGRGLGVESQKATTGMLREEVAGGYRYRCNDIGNDPDFTSLTFLLVQGLPLSSRQPA